MASSRPPPPTEITDGPKSPAGPCELHGYYDALLKWALDGGEVLIGRGPECHIRIEGDAALSLVHARLTVHPNGRLHLRDASSTNKIIPLDTLGNPRSPTTELLNWQVEERVLLGRTVVWPVRLRRPGELPDSFHGIVGRARCIRTLCAELSAAAPSEATVLLTGESGTGKSTAARVIHELSPRRAGPFEEIDCSALPGETLIDSALNGHLRGAFTGADRPRLGAFRKAQGGTAFVDEIGELSLQLQAKLLRALERRVVLPVGSDERVPFDARLIAATHQNLAAKLRDGSFRSDLYHRLRVIEIRLPSLREHFTDIPDIIATMVAARGSPPRDITPQAMAFLMSYDWPGNVRELRNVIDRLYVNTPAHLDIGLHHVQSALAPPVESSPPRASGKGAAGVPARGSEEDLEWAFLPGKHINDLVAEAKRKALKRTGTKKNAKDELGVSLSTMKRFKDPLGEPAGDEGEAEPGARAPAKKRGDDDEPEE